MLNVPDEAVAEFQMIYQKRFGSDISLEEAKLYVRHLFDFYAAVLPNELFESEISNIDT